MSQQCQHLPAPSFPTQSLKFLEYDYTNEHTKSQGSKVLLKIVIVGAGLGGLATAIALARRGFEVVVLEQAAQLGEVGAGIQIPSNSCRLLLSWGLGPFLKNYVVEPEGISFRRWENGDQIGYTRLIPDFLDNFKAPYYVVHRAHFHSALHKKALELGVQVIVDSKVVSYDMDAPFVVTVNGTKYSGDLVVACDGMVPRGQRVDLEQRLTYSPGVKSRARELILGQNDTPPLHTGFAAYRATVSAEKLMADPDTSWLLEKPALNIWIGENRHVMTYTIAAGKSFNMVLSHIDLSDPSTWKQDTALEDMRGYFKGWDPRLTKVINMIESVMKWPLMMIPKLNRWVASSGKAVFMGDAAHAMVPYMSQGAAMAVEDGAALAEALHLMTTKEDLQKSLKVFEMERVKRSSQMQEASLLNGKLWHFADGPVQRARDEAMRPEVEGKQYISSPNQWSDPVTQWWCYGYDAEEAVTKAWKDLDRPRAMAQL